MCERREKRVLGEEAPAPTEGSRSHFPGAGITRGDVSRLPLPCAANPGTTKEGGFPSQASTRYCTRNEQTLLLPYPPAPKNSFGFFSSKCCPSRGTVHKPGRAQPPDGSIGTLNDRTLHCTARSRPSSPWEWVPWPPAAPREPSALRVLPRTADGTGCCPGPPEPKGFSSKQLTC